MQSNADKIRYLDGLRGVAALAVVLAHVLIGFYPTFYTGDARQAHNSWEVWAAGSPFNMVSIGNCFVCIFFMLSGYVLTYSVLSKQRQNQFLALAVGRYVRLTLPILASSFLAFLVLKVGWVYHVEVALDTNSYWWMPTLYQFTPSFADMSVESLYGVYQFDTNYNAALWTMRIELLGSFMVFGILMFCRTVKLRMAAYLLVSVFLLGPDHFYSIAVKLHLTTYLPGSPFFFSPYYFCFIAGMFFYDVREVSQQPSKTHRATSTALNILLILFGAFLGSYPQAYTAGTWYQGIAELLVPKLSGEAILVAHLAGAVLLMLAVERSMAIRKILCGAFLQFVGRNAFSIYLLHLILIVSVFAGSFKWAHSLLPYDAAFFVAATIFLALLLSISNAMFYLVDRPSVQFSRDVGRAIEAAQRHLMYRITLKWKGA